MRATEYKKYQFDKTEWLLEGIPVAVETGILAILLFRSFWGLFLLLPYGLKRLTERRQVRIRKRLHMLYMDFKEVVLSIAFSLQAGYALEQTIPIAREDLERTFPGEDRPMKEELMQMEQSMSLGEPVEELFKNLALRSGLKEIRSYAEVLAVSKRQGGNLVRISKEAAEHISRSIQVQSEIEQVLAGKKMEKEIMLVMPYFILIYLQVTNGSYLDPLFTEWTGRVLMCFCLVVILIAREWAERIMQIEV